MNWYNSSQLSPTTKRMVLASPKNRIAQYKVQSPTLQSLIYKYENAIDWQEVKQMVALQADQPEVILQEYVRDRLVAPMFANTQMTEDTDSSNPFYLFSGDLDLQKEFEQGQDNPQIQQAYEVYQQDPAAAEKQILDAVNGSKQEAFQSWTTYMTEGNDVYAQDPAFQYLMAKPIFDKALKPSKGSAQHANAAAIASVWQSIQNGKLQSNIGKDYYNAVAEEEKKKSEFIPTSDNYEDGWLHIPGLQNDAEEFFEENVARLTTLSQGTGWCTGTGMAEAYLTQGRFLVVYGGQCPVCCYSSCWKSCGRRKRTRDSGA